MILHFFMVLKMVEYTYDSFIKMPLKPEQLQSTLTSMREYHIFQLLSFHL